MKPCETSNTALLLKREVNRGCRWTLYSVQLFFGLTFPWKRKQTRTWRAGWLRAGSSCRCDIILMTLCVSWRPPFGRLMFYQIFIKPCVPLPSSLRSHNASVMLCQVRHDERWWWSEAPGGMVDTPPASSSLPLKFVWMWKQWERRLQACLLSPYFCILFPWLPNSVKITVIRAIKGLKWKISSVFDTS